MKKPRLRGGSQNPIVFHDYESYVAKFANNEKTTDDTYTPPDVYEAVLNYVKSIYPMEGKVILRPFYPNGDYEHADYPENGVVIDNPPFSIFTEICRFYSERKIPFFLFGNGLTIFSCLKYCSAVIIAPRIEFTNGAKIQCNFATNLIGDTLVTTAHELSKAIAACPSQTQGAIITKYQYPKELLAVSDFQTMARGNENFAIKRSEAVLVGNLDNHPKKGGLFGYHLLTSPAVAERAAQVKEAARGVVTLSLSEREQAIVNSLKR